jgi:hypothetical protein
MSTMVKVGTTRKRSASRSGETRLSPSWSAAKLVAGASKIGAITAAPAPVKRKLRRETLSDDDGSDGIQDDTTSSAKIAMYNASVLSRIAMVKTKDFDVSLAPLEMIGGDLLTDSWNGSPSMSASAMNHDE